MAANRINTSEKRPGFFRALLGYKLSGVYQERYWFYKFRYSTSPSNILLRQLYNWWDHARQPGQSASLAHVLEQEQLNEARAALMKLEQEILFNEKGRQKSSPRHLKRVLIYFRNHVQQKVNPQPEDPVSPYQQGWHP